MDWIWVVILGEMSWDSPWDVGDVLDNSQPATFQVSLPEHQHSGSWAESMDLSIHHHPAGTHAATMSVCDMTFGGNEGQTKFVSNRN